MQDPSPHTACVDSLIARLEPTTAAECILILHTGVATVWKRASPTLGPITLGAILRRVLRTARAAPEFVETLRIDESGLSVQAALARPGDIVGASSVDKSVRAILTELLGVLDDVTAGILVRPVTDSLLQLTRRDLGLLDSARTEEFA